MISLIKTVRVALIILLAVVAFRAGAHLEPLTRGLASWVALGSLGMVLNAAMIAAMVDEPHVEWVLRIISRRAR